MTDNRNEKRKAKRIQMDFPWPGEWHPWYQGKTWIGEWVERRGPFADHYQIYIPVPQSIRLTSFDLGEFPEAKIPQIRTMTRKCVVALAPYTGRPFHYEWWVGADDLGRMIAGEARIVYDERHPGEEVMPL